MSAAALVEVTGWPLRLAAERAELHVEMCLAEGGFARIVPLGDGRVCWLGPDGWPWRHVPDGYRRKVEAATIRARALREAGRKPRGTMTKAMRRALAANARAAKAAKRARLGRERAVRAQAAGLTTGPVLTARQTKRGLSLIPEVARRHDLAVEAVIGAERTQKVCRARHEAMWLIRELRNQQGDRLFGLSRIGRMFGRDWSSVAHGLRRHAERAGVPFEDEELAALDAAWRPAA